MSLRNRTNSFVEHVRGFIHRPASHTKQSPIELGSFDATDVLGSSLHKEAIGGGRRALKKVLLSAVWIDYPNNRGQTPLFCACARDNEANALLLLQYGANPNEKSQEGITPTHAACYVGNIHLLGKLIEAGGDLRLHDNEGNGVKEWALRNPDPKSRAKMLEFLVKMHVCAMAYTGDAANADNFSRSVDRRHKHTSLMEFMKMRTGIDSTFENLKRVQSMGFGKVYLGGDFSGGIVSVVPLVSEALLTPTDNIYYDTGIGTFIEQMKWAHMLVSVKKVRPDVEPEEGIDNIISEAEFLGKLRHPNVVLLMGICQSTSLEDMWLIFELFEDATLHYFLHRAKSKLELSRKWCIINQVCNAMEFIHHQNLIHCGLSSMAIYLVSPHVAKVGNFEFMVESIKADLGKASQVASISRGRILYNWMAPELMKEEAPHFSSDIYSFCCIVWELFTGEMPWAGLKAQDIFQKIVEENTPLDLNHTSLPSKFKAIVGYGLELHEKDRLHKFSLISHWLKSEEIPEFQRSHSSLHWVNKSSNHVELTSSSSQSSSVLSISSKGNTSATATQEFWNQDRASGNKRFSLDFESPVNADFHSFRAVSLSQYVTQEDKLKVSTDESDKEHPPRKPPRSFTYSHCYDPTRNAYDLSQKRKAANNPNKKTSKRIQKSPSSSSEKQKANSLPVSPTRIKPASHSYIHGIICESNAAAESQPNTSAFMLSKQWKQEEKSVGGTCNVKEMAEKYQHIQNQHKLRQAIIKGSMAPRGSCQYLKTSSESINTESFELDGGLEPALSSHGKQSRDLGSLSSTPVMKSSSTPKVIMPNTQSALSCGEHAIVTCNPQAAATKQPIMANLSAESCLLDGGYKAAKIVHKFPQPTQESFGEAGASKESPIQRRRALIEDIKQKHHLKDKSVGENKNTSPGFQYSSPVLKFHSPDTSRQGEKLKMASDTVEEIPECITSSKIATKFVKDQALEPVFETPRSPVTRLCRTASPRCTSFEDDSFWAITTLGPRENKTRLDDAAIPETKKDIFSILHADFPGKGCRVIIKAEGLSLGKVYYQGGEQLEHINTEPVSNQEAGSQLVLPELGNNLQPKLSECGPSITSSETKTAEINEQRSILYPQPSETKMEAVLGDPQILLNKQTSPVDGNTMADKDNGEEDALGCLDGGVKDVHNETFTLDSGSPEWVYVQDTSLGQESDKVIQWVDKELNKIKDNLSQNIDSNTGLSNSPRCKEDYPVMDRDSSSRDQACVPVKRAVKNAHDREARQSSDIKGKALNDEFEFHEYYIDDDLNKMDQMQQMTLENELLSSQYEKTSITASKQLGLPLTLNQQASKVNENRENISKVASKYQPKLESSSLASSCDSAISTSIKLDRRPLLIPRTRHCPIENICQSAMTKSTELENARQKVLSRQSASDKDLSLYKGVHLIARNQGSYRGREGVPAKPGVKQTFVSDSLRSGASDPSFSTSLVKERGTDTSQQETSLGDDTNCEDENTLIITSQDLDEPTAGGSCWSKGKKDEIKIKGGLHMPEKIFCKDEASQVELEYRAMRPYEVQPSDSVESDEWVKAKLGNIQRKIQRRKARTEYLISSDEDDESLSHNQLPGRTTLSGTSIKSFLHFPKTGYTLDMPKPNRCKSLFDMGIHMDENYSKVMEELKFTYKARRNWINASSNWRKEDGPHLTLQTKRINLKQPSFITSDSADHDNLHASSRSTERKVNSQNHAVKLRMCSDNPNRASKKSKILRPKNFIKSYTKDGPEKSPVSHYSCKSLQENSEEFPKKKTNRSVREESSRCAVLKNQKKESGAKYSSLPNPKPQKDSKRQAPKLMIDDQSSDHFTEVSEELTDPRLLMSSLSKQAQSFSDEKPSSTTTTERWLHNQNLKRNHMWGCQNYNQFGSERSSIKSGGKSLAESSQCSVMSRSKNGSHGTSSKHSIVSFSKIVDMDRKSDSSKYSARLGQHNRCEGQSKKSHLAARFSPRHKRANKARPQTEESTCYLTPPLVSDLAGYEVRTAKLEEHQVTVGLEQSHDRDETCKLKNQQRKENLGFHRFYIPRESWPGGYSTKLNVEVGKDSQRVTTTATNLASGHMETLLDQVVLASKLKSTIHME